MARARITHPQSVPVAGTDAHLPALPAHRLQPEGLRQRFAEGRAWAPEFPGDGGLFEGRTPAAASVLVPLVQREDGLHVLLTRRTDHLHDHAGQISFPGGRRDEGDADVFATALRETEEEVGLSRRHIQILGQLPTYTTVTHYVVTPVVALVRPPFELNLDSFEVAEAFEVPLPFLMTPAHHQRHVFEMEGQRRQFLSMPWRQDGRDYFIWGATAAMLRNLYAYLAAGED
ncbi:MAG: CoA pyrophosphatase [Rubrivivax sp.]|nr:CoA pyrophosphatase [Rubrivivax sp.]